MANWKVCVAAAMVLGMMAANAASPEPADQPVDTAKAMLDRMDRNVDGKISIEEYRNAMIRRFGARDLNDDGVLEGDEFPKEWLAGADVQGATGKVTWEQFAIRAGSWCSTSSTSTRTVNSMQRRLPPLLTHARPRRSPGHEPFLICRDLLAGRLLLFAAAAAQASTVTCESTNNEYQVLPRGREWRRAPVAAIEYQGLLGK